MRLFQIIYIYRWSLIAGRLPGRTDNEIKNYWNTHIRRKLLSRGIDPATHRSLNDSPRHNQAQESAGAATICFAPKQEEKDNNVLFVEVKDSKSPTSERCPDLNLELSISPPHHEREEGGDGDEEESKSIGRSLCFACSLGLQNSKDCSCALNAITANANASSATGFDFLGLKTSPLDYRTLQMK